MSVIVGSHTAGTVVERHYKISNLERYKNQDFLNELDEITADEGITILKRTIDENSGSVKIQARFDSDHWDVCRAIDFLSKNGISVYPVSDFTILAENNEIKLSYEKLKQIADTALDNADAN